MNLHPEASGEKHRAGSNDCLSIIQTAMKSPLQILHLEDDQADAELVQSLLEADGLPCAITCVKTKSDYETALERGGFDLILSDFSLPRFDGMTALAMARGRTATLPPPW